MNMDFSGAAQRWLDEQDPHAVRTAREIIAREEQLRGMPWGTEQERTARARENGFIQGMFLVLSYLRDRPGDIGQTGARGFATNVLVCDEAVAKAKAEAE